MRAKLSVVIPTLNAEDGLRRSLPPLAEGLQAGLLRELTVSDGGSSDGTLQIAEAAGAHVVSGPPSRGGQLRRGAAATGGAWILFLHADCTLPAGWTDTVLKQIDRGGPAAFRLRFDAEGLLPGLVAGWANLRSRVFGLPYGDQGLLISRDDYEAVGGYPDIPLMEDVALARALRGRIALLPSRVCTASEKFARDGWLRRGGGNLFRVLRYFLGADPVTLARRY
ncbi:MAG: TIGR04283 family arsenosugar biosynthesis glycosyltransferase [Pseudomonadota bacterium]